MIDSLMNSLTERINYYFNSCPLEWEMKRNQYPDLVINILPHFINMYYEGLNGTFCLFELYWSDDYLCVCENSYEMIANDASSWTFKKRNGKCQFISARAHEILRKVIEPLLGVKLDTRYDPIIFHLREIQRRDNYETIIYL